MDSTNHSVDSSRTIQDGLLEVSHFTHLTQDQASEIASLFSLVDLPKDAVVRTGLGSIDHMHLLISGKVRLSVASGESKQIVLSHLEPPAICVGSCPPGGPLDDIRILALTESRLLRLDLENLQRAIVVDPSFALFMMNGLVSSWRDAVAMLVDTLMSDATHRVMRTMVNIASANYESTGIPLIQGMTHAEIAGLSGTARETASRVISAMAKEGLVATKGRKTVVDIVRIQERLKRV